MILQFFFPSLERTKQCMIIFLGVHGNCNDGWSNAHKQDVKFIIRQFERLKWLTIINHNDIKVVLIP